MRLAILSGEFPPRCSGLGDYSAKVAAELLMRGHTIGVWTAEASVTRELEWNIHKLPQPWNRSALVSLIYDLKKMRPDAISLQYTPQSIAKTRLGNHLLFPFWLFRLKRSVSAPLMVTVHELNYPVEFSLRGVLLGIPQLLQMIMLLLIADIVFFTTEPVWKRVSHWLFWKKKFYWLPVGANIECLDSSVGRRNQEEARIECGIAPHQHLLLYFGGLHPTHLIGHIKSAYLKARQEFGSEHVRLVCIGTKRENIEKHFLREEEQEAFKEIKIFSYLIPSSVSLWLTAADLVLAPFMDGISTRRSSAMSAFQHGKPILTTFGRSSSGSIPWAEFCFITRTKSKSEYMELAAAILTNKEELLRTGFAAKKFYDARFSWPTITDRMIKFLDCPLK